MEKKQHAIMPPMIAFIGWHNAGKTTLARKVLACLTEKGYRVAVLKASKETGLCPDWPGSDTSLYQESGAERVALLAPDQTIIRGRPAEPLALIRHCFQDMDLVIIEGLKFLPGIPKIEVRRRESGPGLAGQTEGIIALVTAAPVDGPDAELAVFRPEQYQELADFIEQQTIKTRKSL